MFYIFTQNKLSMRLLKYLQLFFIFIFGIYANGYSQTCEYDFSILKGEIQKLVQQNDSSILVVSDRQYREYTSDTSIYCIQTHFYQNGVIKEKGKLIPPHLKFGEWEYFNENGELSKKKNEDERFGKVTLSEILKFSFKNKYAYRKNIYPLTRKDNELIEQNSTSLSISFVDNKKEWKVRYDDSYYYHEYTIDGETGKIISLLRQQTVFFFDDLVGGKVTDSDAAPVHIPVADNETIYTLIR